MRISCGIRLPVIWDIAGLRRYGTKEASFSFISRVMASGGLDTMPEERPQRMGPPPDLVPPIIGIVLLLTAVAVIVLGRLLARMVSRQILGPLAELSRAADAIRKGDLSQPVSIPSHDEVGQVCADFEQMRRELGGRRGAQS